MGCSTKHTRPLGRIRTWKRPPRKLHDKVQGQTSPVRVKTSTARKTTLHFNVDTLGIVMLYQSDT